MRSQPTGALRQGLAPKSVRNTHVVFRKALADAERLGLVQRNAAAAAWPPGGKSAERQTWTAEELRRFLIAVEGDRLYALWLLLATGRACRLRCARAPAPRPQEALAKESRR